MSRQGTTSPKYDRRVRRAVRDLERQGARAKPLDGTHVLMLPPEGVDGPSLKVSASRKPEDTLRYLRRQFAEPCGLVLP